jgi:hypothetical protein
MTDELSDWLKMLSRVHDDVTTAGHRYYCKTGYCPEGWQEINIAIAEAKQRIRQHSETPKDTAHTSPLLES